MAVRGTCFCFPHHSLPSVPLLPHLEGVFASLSAFLRPSTPTLKEPLRETDKYTGEVASISLELFLGRQATGRLVAPESFNGHPPTPLKKKKTPPKGRGRGEASAPVTEF